MFKICTEKHNDIIGYASNMEVKKMILLGFMGMARTNMLLKHISKHTEFSDIYNFDMFIKEGVKKFLYYDTNIDNKIDEGIEICNSLIPDLEEFDYESCFDKKDEDIMGISYSLIENWYYFIGMISEDIDNENCKKFIQFLSVPITCIDTYLCNKYSQIGNYNEVQKKVNDDILTCNEIRLIEDDLAFVETDYELSNIEDRIKKYLKYNILD